MSSGKRKITVLVTGPIGGGKSEVCRMLAAAGLPVYDSDSRTKALYDSVPGLLDGLEGLFGESLRSPDGRLDRKKLAGIIFSDASKRLALEEMVYPAVLEDFERWRDSVSGDTVVMESAVALGKSIFNGSYDKVLMVTAPLELRVKRNPAAAERDASQSFDPGSADWTIVNDGDLGQLQRQVDSLPFVRKTTKNTDMKTDLAKILAVSGHHGLYNYIAQARNGAIAEALSDKKRTVLDAHSRITTLADIAIYTSEGEMKLQDVFLALKETLGEAQCPSSKGEDAALKELFAKAVPNYDADRFYVSHMRKIADWYSELDKYASFDFVEEGEEAEEKADGEEEA